MKAVIEGAPSFAHVHIDLAPGESVTAESDAMASMQGGIDLKAKFNGGFFSGLLKKFLGGESLFVSVFSNPSDGPKRLTLVQSTPGDIKEISLNGNALCVQPGGYVASTPGISLKVKWAGFRSLIAGEGLFKLYLSGKGTVWIGAYGGILFKDVDGAFLVDTSHLVAYEPHMKLRLQLAGGLFSSFFGGEGIVSRLEGKGKIAIQTRSLSGLKNWINPMLW